MLILIRSRFFFGEDGKPAPSEILRAAPFGRIAFANTDLAGIWIIAARFWKPSAPVDQLLDQVLAD
jgi:spermidine dehydrogenase